MVALITRILYMSHKSARCWMIQVIRDPLYSASGNRTEATVGIVGKLFLMAVYRI